MTRRRSRVASTPTGTITVRLFPPSDPTCSGSASYTNVITISGNSDYFTLNQGDNPGGFAANATGIWHWTADYSGDAINNSATSGCAAEPVTVLNVSTNRRHCYTYLEINDGQVNITSPSVSDPDCGSVNQVKGDLVHNIGDANDDSILNPGETWTFTCTKTLVTDRTTDLPTTSNTAVAHGTDPLGNDVTSCPPAIPRTGIRCDPTRRIQPRSRSMLLRGSHDLARGPVNGAQVEEGGALSSSLFPIPATAPVDYLCNPMASSFGWQAGLRRKRIGALIEDSNLAAK
jgi:hypothetical protein